MKTIPVTPELLSILENALHDSLGFIDECEQELENYTETNGVRKAVVHGIERRRQLIAVTRDLLERYKD